MMGSYAPLSTTLACVVRLAGIFFAVMLIQDIIMFLEESTDDHDKSEEEKAADPNRWDWTIPQNTAIAAGLSLSLAPLLCILFVATRMRALQITQQAGDPPGWAQDCMIVAVCALIIQSICTLALPAIVGSATKVDEDGNPDYDLKPMIGAYAVAVVKYVALMALHGCVIAIAVAVYVMTPETAHGKSRMLENNLQLLKGGIWLTVILVVALLFSSAKVVGMAIKFALESADQKLIGVDMTLQKCALNLFNGYVHFQRLKVLNPVYEREYTTNKEGKFVGYYKLLNGTRVEEFDEKRAADYKKCDWVSDYIAKIDVFLVKLNLWRLLTTLGKEFEIENISITGIDACVEKPNTDITSKNTNLEYLINHMNAIGLIHEKPAAKPDEKKPEEKKPEEKKPEEKKPAEKKPEGKESKEKEEGVDFNVPSITIGKIALGDIGAGVRIRNVKFIGEINFHPHIGLFESNNVTEDIFHGQVLKPEEMVALIIHAFAQHVFDTLVHEIPNHIAEAARGAVMAVAGGADCSSCGDLLKKIPCYGEPEKKADAQKKAKQ
jgi:hypothetical protein